MVIPTYLKQRQSRAFSKYHMIQGEISSKYQFIREKVVSQFHEWSQPVCSQIDQTTLDFVRKYDFPLPEVRDLEEKKEETKAKSKLTSTLFWKSQENVFKERLDWTRARISGKIVRIVVLQGIIIEKVYLTAKGNIICVKRSELGLLAKIHSSLEGI